MSWRLIIDIIGWIGSIEVILAYGLNSYQRISANSLSYQLLNLTGGIFLIINTVYYGSYPSTAINVVWVVIATIAIGSLIRRK